VDPIWLPTRRGDFMVLAISLIKAVPDREKVVYRSLKEVDGVKNLYHIFGDHDLLLILEAESRIELMKLLNYIEEISFVNSVKILLVAPTDRHAINACNLGNVPSNAGKGERYKCLP
ncbi:MAG: Lrp/AsnC ligand binding domain-containing protein, partial [Methanothrix sp.]|nr:Lrp/AsnC ligand binding domain-containing protein [Methanothrix sp.]